MSFACTYCQVRIPRRSENVFYWNNCRHKYCINCIPKLVNKYLSNLNQIPKCSGKQSRCSQLLSVQKGDVVRNLLLKKYSIDPDITNYTRKEYLIYGYLRRTNKAIPYNIIFSIFDYYHLIYFRKSNCYKCEAVGRVKIDCSGCEGLGYTTDCKSCDESGKINYKIECSKCNGSGDYKIEDECRRCNGSGLYRVGECRSCHGQGQTYLYRVDKCSKCNGTGNYTKRCFGCNGTGTFRKVKVGGCYRCNGNGIIRKSKKCGNCRGSGVCKTDCRQVSVRCYESGPVAIRCYGSGQVSIRCGHCKGKKRLMVLDFQELIQKQLLCKNCNKYFPNNQIIYWSTCNHSYCYECISLRIMKQIDNDSIPICGHHEYCLSVCNICHGNGYVSDNCKKCRKTGVLCRAVKCNKCDKNGYFKKQIKIHCKTCGGSGYYNYRVMCRKCNGFGMQSMHTMYQKCRWCKGTKVFRKQKNCGKCKGFGIFKTKCKHCNGNGETQYLKSCTENLTLESLKLINMENKGYGKKLKAVISRKNSILCKNCFQSIQKYLVFTWSKCNHNYCKKCASEIINESLSLLNEIPKCVFANCNQSLEKIEGDKIKFRLLQKYLVTDVNISNKKSNNSLLICGYWRIVCGKFNRLPVDMCRLIYDYYQLVYSTIINCYDCKFIGSKIIDCDCCDGFGYIENCKGTNGVYKCRGAGYNVQKCYKCGGMGKVSRICCTCNGKTKLAVLNFGNVCNKQKICNKCNCYFPNDMVIYWPQCYHQYCYNCVVSHMSMEMNQNNLPTCLLSNCTEQITVKSLQLMNVNNNKAFYAKIKRLISLNNKIQCNKCKKMKLKEQVFLWSKCSHEYCINCASTIINESLSLSNEIPKCIATNGCLKCNQSLHIRTADLVKDSFFKKYKIQSDNYALNKHHEQEYLVYGILRSKSFGARYFNSIPSDIVCSILDFYQITFSTKINCYNCNSIGHVIEDCSDCQSFGYTEDCVSSGLIYKCRGSAYNRKKCNFCNTRGKISYSCYKCRGGGKTIVLDFNKLVYRQSFCNNCNNWFPKNMVLYWSQCYHTFCYKCISRYISNELNKNRIPVCLAKFKKKGGKQILSCKVELISQTLSNNLPLLELNNHYGCVNQLDVLIYRKDKFLCSYKDCNKWHSNNNAFVWTKCNHRYGKSCVKKYVDKQLIKDESILNVFKDQFIPKCTQSNCNELLSLNDATGINITKYQYETLKKMIKKQKKMIKKQKKSDDCIVM